MGARRWETRATRRAATALSVLMFLAACSSTAREGARGPGSSPGDPLTSTPGATASALGPGATAGATPGASLTPGARGSGGGTAPGSPASGPPVEVGIRYLSGAEQLASNLGIRGFSVPDTRAMAQAIVDELNRQGGLAGRRIVPLFHAYDASNPAGTATEEQKACSFFTEDHRPPVVISALFSSDVLQTCLARRGTLLIDENYGFFDMKLVPDTYYVPGFPDPVRSASFLVDTLAAQGFFAGGKIGISRKDTPDRKRISDAIRSALARHGLSVSDEIRYSTTHPQALSAGILRFRSSEINRVFILDIGGLESGTFMQQAQSQGFHPRYALDTRNNPIYLTLNADPRQLRGSAGAGWFPSIDVGRVPAKDRSAEEVRCEKIMSRAGVELKDAGNDRLAYSYCDAFFLLKAAAERGRAVTSAAIRAGVESLGSTYRPTGSFASRFGPRRHDGTTAGRRLAFNDACGCFQYTGGLVGMG